MERVLETIVRRSRADLELCKREIAAAKLEKRIAALAGGRDFRGALQRSGVRVIAELKAASPSAGVIRQPFDVAGLADELAGAGAAALSVLTERNYFMGSMANLEIARARVDIPLLRKDFIYDEYQLLEARAAGADAVLLIAAMLSGAEYSRLRKFATDLGLAVLSEAHTHDQLAMLLDHGADMIGINSRDLSTFGTSLERMAELIQTVPGNVIRVAESAIREAADLARLRECGADAFLIGETLMRAERPGRKLCELLAR